MEKREFLFSLSSLILGIVLGQYIPPLINWKIEEKRMQRIYRMEMVKQWRNGIESIDDSEWNGMSVADKSWYSSLRLHMKKNIVNSLGRPRTLIVPREDGSKFPRKHELSDEIARIEKECGLL